jgi:mRNA interferase MazF
VTGITSITMAYAAYCEGFFSTNGLDQNRFIDVAQVRSVDSQRILGLLGRLEDQYWPQIKTALDIVLGFSL